MGIVDIHFELKGNAMDIVRLIGLLRRVGSSSVVEMLKG